MNYKLGDEAQCKMCGERIQYLGPHWEHFGEAQPRHPAWPAEDEPKVKPVLPLGKRSIENLTHFQCPTCKGWFTIGFTTDDPAQFRKVWGCPWCYTVSVYDSHRTN